MKNLLQFLTAACAALLLAAPAGAAEKPVPERVTLTAVDGVQLACSWWPQTAAKAPRVLLLHQLSRNRGDWDVMAARLNQAGFSVLAMDFRGHGESNKAGNRRLDFTDFSVRDWKLLPGDVTCAVNWLARQAGADSGRIALVGASIGANSALLAAAADKRVHTLVLLSPGLDYHGLKTERAMEQYGTRSIFLLASADDEYSAGTVKRLGLLARGRNAVKVFQKAGHGTSMFGVEPTLPVLIEGWLKENL
jgi:alpha-beta hydrolase superfamily lysophospholipase